jgi:SNF2 family DNA or RNA helicase
MGSIAATFPDGLRVPQIVGALQIVQQQRVLLADQPGAGKTAQALFAAEMAGIFESAETRGGRAAATLIMCNVTGCQLTWAGELKNRVATQHDVVIADLTDTAGRKTMPSVAQRNDALGRAMLEANDLGLPLIVLANFDLARWKQNTIPKLSNLWDIVFDMMVIDEGHLVLPTMEDKDDKLTQFWYGLKRIQLTAHPLLLDLTGTPDRGKLWNRYGHWKFLHPDQHRSFWSWARLNFVVTAGVWGGAEIGKLRSPDAWNAFDRRHMIRRTKAEMLEGLPEKQWAGDGGIDLPMTQVQQDAYDDYESYVAKREQDLIADDKANEAAGLRLQFAMRSQQMATCTWDFIETPDAQGRIHTKGTPRVKGPAFSNKLAWILDWLDARGYLPEGFDPTLGKVVIVSRFVEVLHWLEAELAAAGVECLVMSGDTPATVKQSIEAEFQRGSLRIVLLSMSVGVSINLDAADDMIFVEPSHNPDEMEQAEDRIHRASRNHQVTIWRLVSVDTADMVVLQTVDTRYRTTRQSYEGSRGVQFARRMLGIVEMMEVEA